MLFINPDAWELWFDGELSDEFVNWMPMPFRPGEATVYLGL